MVKDRSSHQEHGRGRRSGGGGRHYHSDAAAYHKYLASTHEQWLTYEETLVHFHKSFGVMRELFDHREFATLGSDLFNCSAAGSASLGALAGPRFLDIGCAPGGFSACLLQEVLGPSSVGFGISLPPHMGGFNMTYHSERLCVQFEDILGLQPTDLMCPDNTIDMCCADAQNLSNFFKQKPQKFHYKGIRAKSRSLGIWALTVKECQLAFSKLRTGGSFIFRFGWRGVGEGASDVHPSGEKVHPQLLARYLEEEEWYKALTHWLFSVLKSLFSELKPFKSEYVHQADVSFYMVCRTFDRVKYQKHNWEAKLQRAFDELSNCSDEASLVAGIKAGILDSTKATIDELLEYVGRMRAIGIHSRKITNPSQYKEKYEGPQTTAAQKKEGSAQDEKEREAKTRNEERQRQAELGKEDDKEEELSAAGADSEQGDSSTTAAEAASSSVPSNDAAEHGVAEEPPSNEPVTPAESAEAAGCDACSAPATDAEAVAEAPDATPASTAASPSALPVAYIGSASRQERHPLGSSSMPSSSSGTTPANQQASAMSSLDVESLYKRQMYVSNFQSKLQEQKQTEDARRRQQEEDVRRWQQEELAFHMQTFHSQLQQQQQQQQPPFHPGHLHPLAQESPSDLLLTGMETQEQLHRQFAPMAPPSGVRQALAPADSPPPPPSWSADAGIYEWSLPQHQGASAAPWQATTPALGGPTAAHLSATQPPLPPPPPPPAPPNMEPAVGSSSPPPWSPSVVEQPSSLAPALLATSVSSATSSRAPGHQAPPAVPPGSLPAAPLRPPVPRTAPTSSRCGGASVSSTALPGSPGPGSLAAALASEGTRLRPPRPSVLSSLRSGGSDMRERRETPIREPREHDVAAAAGDCSDSSSSSDNGDGAVGGKRRRGYRHKRRAGRTVRERRLGRQRRHGSDVSRWDFYGDFGDAWWSRSLGVVSAFVSELKHGELILHATRFGLFCAMAWSMNSIILSILRLYTGEA